MSRSISSWYRFGLAGIGDARFGRGASEMKGLT